MNLRNPILTPLTAPGIKPYRVAESPALECRVQEIIPLGSAGGAATLFCRVLGIHIREDIVGDNDRIDPHKMGLDGSSWTKLLCPPAVLPCIPSSSLSCSRLSALMMPFLMNSDQRHIGLKHLAHFAGLSFLPSSDDVEKHVRRTLFGNNYIRWKTGVREAHPLHRRHLVHTGTEHAWHLMFG